MAITMTVAAFPNVQFVFRLGVVDHQIRVHVEFQGMIHLLALEEISMILWYLQNFENLSVFNVFQKHILASKGQTSKNCYEYSQF